MAKREVNPIVSILALIMIAAVAGVMTFWFVTDFIVRSSRTVDLRSGVLSIDYVYVDSANGTITAYIRNIGSSAIRITAAYIFTPNGDEIRVSGTSLSPTQIVIYPGEVGIVVLSGLTLRPGNIYVVRLIADDGTSLTFSVKAK